MELKQLRALVKKTGDRDARIALADAYVNGDRIIQYNWRTRKGGREYVCALAAFGPDINGAHCPADLMPDWLAKQVPILDDTIPAHYVPVFARGLVERAKRWHVLTGDNWEAVHKAYFACARRGVAGDNSKPLILRLFELIDDELEKVEKLSAALTLVSRETSPGE